MIFDLKPIEDLCDAEIRSLVEGHVAEQQHLEFKVTVKHQEPEARLELLLDVASLANGGGGYLIVGIRDDGRGSAQRFEDPGDTVRISQSIRDLCHQHIVERIEGLSVRERIVDGHPLVIVRVPVSDRLPHMVALDGRTHFSSRYEAGKRPMTLAEIREVFTGDTTSRRLVAIEQALEDLAAQGRGRPTMAPQTLRAAVEAGEARARLKTGNGADLSLVEATRFREEVQKRPAFYLSATPVVLRERAVDVDRPAARRLLHDAPGYRPGGWMVASRFAEVERFAEGLRYRDRGLNVGQLELLENGHLAYRVSLGESFYWGLPREEWIRQPRLFPGAVLEYPLTFLLLYRAICDQSSLEGQFYVRLEYRNIGGHRLPPGPVTEFFDVFGIQQPIAAPHISEVLTVERDFQPHRIAWELAGRVYNSFGLTIDDVPYWNAKEECFSFPGLS
jgi:hypothetical protein